MGEDRSSGAGLLLWLNSLRRVSMAVRSKSVLYGSCEMGWVVCDCRWWMSMIQWVVVMMCGMRI